MGDFTGADLRHPVFITPQWERGTAGTLSNDEAGAENSGGDRSGLQLNRRTTLGQHRTSSQATPTERFEQGSLRGSVSSFSSHPQYHRRLDSGDHQHIPVSAGLANSLRPSAQGLAHSPQSRRRDSPATGSCAMRCASCMDGSAHHPQTCNAAGSTEQSHRLSTYEMSPQNFSHNHESSMNSDISHQRGFDSDLFMPTPTRGHVAPLTPSVSVASQSYLRDQANGLGSHIDHYTEEEEGCEQDTANNIGARITKVVVIYVEESD
ncbi:hypothetical protein JX265_006185 [Neoarthrinium moseri]|uniref:Uncharacterized protein n=1 Tax=Neoarthrinium moseri TaxID=1658444 RepID=A0A9P9WMT6_9PEZI|nr:uncharacterized protein JN550_012589 [Neoarthrinium moseri]KAI1851223.1 hypothetical protein JX266_003298 [Neoarthrinium moseri]KAI1858542.1 hypothetical protein JN550_012589 [Neoarthrinium moseri]KAI1871145.1 hypothetical protein JX265_006185 [Neoarthrinium moseri]